MRVDGNVTADSLRVLRTFEVFPHEEYSDDAVRRGIRKLFALGIFEDIRTERQEHDGVVDIVIHVRERPRIDKFEFSGNHRKSTADLQKKLFLHVGEAYSPTSAQTQVDTLLKLYRDDGFSQAKIDAVPDTTGGRGAITLRFQIQEGEKVKVYAIRIEGMNAITQKKLEKQLKTKQHWFLGGGEVKDENLEEDRQKLEAYYHDHGYRDARVTGQTFEPQKDPRRLTYVVTVDEGKFYRFGHAEWKGVKVIPDYELAKMWRAHPGDMYDLSRVEKAQGDAFAAYAERGYLYLNIEPHEEVRDSTVDLTFEVTEGQPSRIRLVNIVGNKGTRENVIRREISIHEGDQFKRSALIRTQGDVMRLGIFNDVQMDFSPAESTDVDINVKVSEKQVGTASAGAGYTSEAGLTGFIELGHTNVLGNAQSLQLHLERGGRTSDYLLSFTEPWFHDTPTLLGFTAFNSALTRDFYREHHIGASGTIGRPLRTPDFSHVTFGYRIENVTYDSLVSVANTRSVTDSITLQDINPGKAQLTSSLTFTFDRNTTDNPFYPNKGTRFRLRDEFYGGPFLGTVWFHRHRIEGRIYHHLPILFGTTMLRARVGLLGEYAGETLNHVPDYERFRLGGGSTMDPVRGYDDYMIVPEKFDRIFIERFNPRPDTLAGVPGTKYDFRPVRVRYPGGRYFTTYTMEQQFPIVNPLHGVLFFDAGNTWDLGHEYQPFVLKMSTGIGFRIEIPILGNIGFDYAYGFNRDDRPRWVGHFLLGNVNQ